MASVRPSVHPPVRPVVLAGGGATRFGGRPKGLEMVGGRRILDRVVDAFLEAFGTLPLLIANDPQAVGWRPDLEVRADLRPGAGALGGLLSAIHAGGGLPVVLAAWDMPFVPAGLLRELAAGLADHDAVLPASDGRRGVEPLLAAYGPACEAAIVRSLDRGDRRAIAFHAEVRVGILPLERVRTFGDPALIFLNVNESDDLAQAEAKWQARGSARS
ncbi:MAG: molybdenum cofactor guanylyltransferase [Gemmatimonadota bacterium]